MNQGEKDLAISVIADRFIREFGWGWDDSLGDQVAAYVQAEWAVEALEEAGLIR